MRRTGILLFILFSPFFTLSSFSQTEKVFDTLLLKAESLYNNQKYDSALLYNSEAIKLVMENKQNNYLVILSPVVMLNTGKCYKELKDVKNAHKYMTYSLQLARANNTIIDIELAFVELNNLHQYIKNNNLSFNYPEVAVTEEIAMTFPVSKVEKISKDSVRLTIRAGRYDGITDSVKKGVIISLFDEKKTERPVTLVSCYIREINDNFCIAYARYDSALPVLPGDLAELKTRIPLSWRKLDVGLSLSRSILFSDNYRQLIYHPRYLYYYADSLTNTEIVSIMKRQVDEVATELAEDSIKSYKDYKGERGIFPGINIITAMSRSNREHLKLFLSFINEYPRKYLGWSYKISEVYATWIVNNTPMAPNAVMPWLVNIRNRTERQKMAFNLSKDIVEKNLIDKWFNNGMLMANADNIDSAFFMAELIKDACTALKNKHQEGWAEYLTAYTEKKMGNNKRADTLFRLSLKEFKESVNKEGETWSLNAISNLNNSSQVTVSVQTGHQFMYMMTASPNSRYLATGGNYDGFIKIWDISLGRSVASFPAHTDGGVNSLHYSPNGRYLVSSSDDSTIKIWNAYDFSLLNTIKRPKPELDVIFSPDSKQLVAGGKDSLVKFLDFNTGIVLKTFKKHKDVVTSVCFLPTNENYLYSSSNDSMVYKWNLEKNDWEHWYKTKGKVMNIDITSDGKYMSLVCTDTLIRVWKLETDKFYFSVRTNFSYSSNVDLAFPSFTPDSKYMAFALSDDTLDIIELSTLKEQTYRFKSPENTGLYDVTFSPDGSYLAGRLDQGGPIRIFNFSGWDFQTNATINLKDLKNYASIPNSVQFTRDDNGIVVVHEGISKIDLRNGSTSFLYSGAHLFQNNYILLNNENIGLHSDNLLWSSLIFYDYVKKDTVLIVKMPDILEELSRFELTTNNKCVFIGGKNNTIAAFNLPSGKMLFNNMYKTGEEDGIISLRYDSIRQQLFATGKNDKILIIDPLTGTIKGNIIADKPQTIEVTPNHVYITCDKSLVYKYDARTLKLLKKIEVHSSGLDCYGSVMSSDYKYLVVQVADKFVTLDTRTDKVLYEKYDHEYQNGDMAVSHNNRLLATGGFDGKVNLYDLATGNKISTIYTPRGKDFMLVDNEGHYLTPKNTLEAVSFNYNNISYGFEQFDSRFNRPDLVLKKIGRADSSLLKNYYAAWQKRMKKLNITEKDFSADVHLPVVRLKDKFALKPGTYLSEYDLNIECFDAKYSLQSLHVLVNNSPIFGTMGKKIDGNVSKAALSVKVPLSMGNNNVKIYCTNSKGTISLSENIEINSTYKAAENPKTYFIGIAVSNYKDSSMNLRFAAKDVRDLAAMFGSIFKTYEADTLIDQYVTKENILRLREKLLKTSVNDKVIISVNGHGLLSDSLDFYYATHDINFNNPTARGLKYEDLEALLDGIPARKKLLLIDACHSGALDKEELLAQQKSTTEHPKDTANENGSVKGFASRGLIVKNKSGKVDANSTYEVMQNLFADISSGNGAVIISAAGGMEYAFESEKWNNGVFTYCVRKGIEEEKADKEGGNSDKAVDVAELKNYISQKVNELTNGKQRPVSRRENIEYNWVIW